MSRLVSSHPFGCEREVSARQLVTFFCNCVYLGQWELASASFKTIYSSQVRGNLDLKKVLEDVARDPYNNSLGSDSVPTPHHLSWLCLQQLKFIEESGDSSNKEIIPYLQNQVEFCLILSETCPDASEEVVKGLYTHYQHISSQHEEEAPLSECCKDFLLALLYKDPICGAALLRHICQSSSAKNSETARENLLEIHLRSLSTKLQEIISIQGLQNDSEEEVGGVDCSTFYSLLALFDPGDITTSTIWLRIKSLLADLIKCLHGEKSLLERSVIYSSLMGRSSISLLDQFFRLEQQFLLDQLITKGNQLHTAGSQEHHLNDVEECTLALSKLADRQESWNQLFLISLSHQRHFLDLIMETSIHLVQQGDLGAVSSLLQPEEFQPLRPLVLLVAWDHCPNITAAMQLLQYLTDTDQPLTDKMHVLSQPCRELKTQTELVQYCLNWAKEMMDKSGGRLETGVDSLFRSLGAHSALYLLHHCIHIHTLSPQEVLTFLTSCPSPLPPEMNEVPSKKIVKFDLGEELFDEDKLNPDHMRDCSVYHSYVAIRCFMDAIAFCNELEGWQLLEYVKRKHRNSESLVSSSSSAVNDKQHMSVSLHSITSSSIDSIPYQNLQTTMENLQDRYTKQVFEILAQGKDHINKVYPLSYRMEVLENLFSLLFVTHDNAQEIGYSTSEALWDSGDEYKEDKRSSWDSRRFTDMDTPLLSSCTGSPTPMVYSPVNPTFNEVDSIPVRAQGKAERPAGVTSSGLEEKKDSVSHNSVNSDNSIYRIGFIANEFVVRDILTLLKECLVDVSAERFALYSPYTEKKTQQEMLSKQQEAILKGCVSSSIEDDKLQNRIGKLTQFVSEGLWRFQLVSGDHITRKVGQVVTDSLIVNSDSEDEFLHGADHKTARLRRRRKPMSSLGSSQGREVSTRETEMTTDDSVSGTSSTGQRRKRRRHKVSGRQSGHCVSPVSGFIPRMLASQETLLNMCLRRGKYVEARQVVKLFNMDDSLGTREAIFAEHYANALRKLQTQDRKPTTNASSPRPHPPKRLPSFSLSNIANAAAAGVASLSVTSVVDQVLSLAALPVLPLDITRELLNCCPGIGAQLTSDNIAGMIVLDLGCVSFTSWQTSVGLMDIAKKRLHAVGKTATPRHRRDGGRASSEKQLHAMSGSITTVPGFITLQKTLSDIFQEGSSDSSSDGFGVLMRKTAGEILTTATCPNDSDLLKCLVVALNHIDRDTNKASKALKDLKGKRKQSWGSLMLTKGHKPYVRMAMKQLISSFKKYLPAQGVQALLHRSENVEDGRTMDYLGGLYEHVKTLAFLIAEWQGCSKDLGHSEYFQVLDKGPTTILAHLIFRSKVPPHRLEDIAEKLCVNLAHIIIKSCCPKIPPLMAQGHAKDDMLAPGGVHLLNKGIPPMFDPSNADPEVLVRLTLTKLISLMKDVSECSPDQCVLTLSDARSLVASGKHLDILEAARLLQDVNLEHLTSKGAKKSFYVNLYNLMNVHATLWCVEQSIFQEEQFKQSPKRYRGRSPTSHHLDDQSSIPLNQIAIERSVGYKVGQLGVVRLFDLRYIILRHQLPPPKSLHGLLANWSLDLDPQDPWHQHRPLGDPRLVFLLADGRLGSPWLQILSPDLVSHQLQQTMKTFLTLTVHISAKDQEIRVPSILLDYKQDFVGQRDRQSLLYFLSSHLDGEKRCELDRLLNPPSVRNNKSQGRVSSEGSSVQILCRPHNDTFGFTFDSETFHHLHPEKSYQPSLSNSEDGCTHPLIPLSTVKPGEFKLNQTILEYLKTKSEFIAMATSLVGEGGLDLIGESLNDEHFPLQTPDEEKTALKLVISGQTTKESADEFKTRKFNDSHKTLLQYLKYTRLHLISPTIENDRSAMELICKKSLTSETKYMLLASSNSPDFHQFLLSRLSELSQKHEWMESVNLLNSVPFESFPQVHKWRNLRDFLLSNAVHSLLCNSGMDDPSLSASISYQCPPLVNQIGDLSLRRRLVLSDLHHCDGKLARTLLKACHVWTEGEDADRLGHIISTKLKHLSVYEMVTECARRVLMKMKTNPTFNFNQETAFNEPGEEDSDWPYKLVESLCRWQEVLRLSRETPDEVLEILLQGNEYEVAREWVVIVNATPVCIQTLDERQALYLLHSQAPELTKVFQLFEVLQNSQGAAVCLAVCEKVLSNLQNCHSTLFLAEFIVKHLQEETSPQRLRELVLQCIGCKALLSLPDKAHFDYCHLVASPLLLLEQLVMNMKIDWAGRVLTCIQHEVKKQVALCDLNELSLRSCDDLITTYATKALEFAVITPDTPSSMSRASSRATMSSRASVASMQQTAATAKLEMAKRISKSVLTSPKGGMMKTGTTHTKPGGASSSSLPGSGGYLSNQGTWAGGDGKGSFVMPPEPPTPDQWVPDSAATVCMVCNVEKFSMFNRRHHCRRCGRVVCASCSMKTSLIRGTSARTCDDCYSLIFKPKSTDEVGKVQQLREKLSGIPQSSSITSASSRPSGIQIIIGSNSSTSSQSPSQGGLSGGQQTHTDCQYILSLDGDYNHMMRDEFYFDNAPSTSLCLSILDLHSDNRQCANVILDLCDATSKLLQPLSHGVNNPEVDYSLVISMLKYLLLHAKVKYMSGGQSRGMARCEQYLNCVQLIQLLVNNHCSWIPSIEGLTKTDMLRRLRDKLIEEERWHVAMEISTKCGIDPSGVWMAWGMVYLRIGDFITARDKFAKCIKAPLDKNQVQEPKVVWEIIDVLELSSYAPSSKAEAILASLKSEKELLSEPQLRPIQERSLDDPVVVEVMYYLTTYGTHLQTIHFYQMHGALSRAVHYILEKGVTGAVFVEGLLMPCVTSGDLTKLQRHLTNADPSLEKWSHYLTASCSHLEKQGLMRVLYQLQLYMKDFIRAAISCIKIFYLHAASSYVDLHERLPHLHSAKHHLEAYLDERQWGQVNRLSASLVKTPTWGPEACSETPIRLIMTPGEVSKYIHTIELQIQVTKFMYRYHDNYEALMKQQSQDEAAAAAAAGVADVTRVSERHKPKKPPSQPTLLESTKMKAEVVRLIMESGNRVHDGYGLAFRIIQDFKLDSTFIYSQAARHFAKQHRYSSVSQLLGCVRDSGMSTDQTMDEIIGSCIRVIADEPSQTKEADNLIKMIRVDENKINAFILCGKLRSAYLAAVKAGRVEDVRRIANIAKRSGQTAVYGISLKYLTQKGIKLDD